MGFSLQIRVDYLWVYANPEIVVCEGRFKSEYRRRHAAPAYVFYLDLTAPEMLYLDSHTKKEVIPFELEKGMLYRIGYEARSNIMVVIEPISEEIMEQDETEDERQISSYEYES